MTRDELEGVSDTLRVHLVNPRRIAPASVAENEHIVARATNAACGDALELYGRVIEGRLDLLFRARGCWGVVATASFLCESLSGLAVSEAGSCDLRQAIAAAGGLPRARQHAVALFERVLADLLGRLDMAS